MKISRSVSLKPVHLYVRPLQRSRSIHARVILSGSIEDLKIPNTTRFDTSRSFSKGGFLGPSSPFSILFPSNKPVHDGTPVKCQKNGEEYSGHCQATCNDPEKTLSSFHVSDIGEVHAEEGRNETERQKDDGYDSEDEYRFAVILEADIDQLNRTVD